MQKIIYCCRIEDASDNPQLAFEIISSFVEDTVLRKDLEQNKSCHEYYAGSVADARKFSRKMKKLIPLLQENGITLGEPQIIKLRNEDWAESWKKFFNVIKISDKLVVKPAWREYERKCPDEIIIEIDPGMSFGTGNHPTTQFCLELIEKVARKSRPGAFLDAGCGSGILTVAAVKLGFSPVFAIDNDPEALQTSAENLEKNSISEDRYELICANFAEFQPPIKFDVIVANILSGPLIEHRDSLVSLLAPNSPSLILSGIMHNEYESVRQAYESAGLVQKDFLTDENWDAGLFTMANT